MKSVKIELLGAFLFASTVGVYGQSEIKKSEIKKSEKQPNAVLSTQKIGAEKVNAKVAEDFNFVFEERDARYLSKTIKPTEDFFLFSNENWIKNNPVPASESRWGSFNELEKENNKKLTEILENFKNAKAQKGTKEQLLGDFYASYANMDVRNKKGISPIKGELDAINVITSKSELVKLVGKLHIHGVGAFFSFGVGQDLKNVDGHISYFGWGGIGLPNRDYYKDASKEEIRTAYKKYITDALILAGLKDAKSIEKAVQNIYRIEDEIATILLKPAEMRIPELTYNKYGKEQLSQEFDAFDFNAYLKAIGISNFDTLIVDNPKYATQINKIIKEESIDALKDYLTWQTLSHYIGSLGQEFVDLNFAFHGITLSGKKEMKPINERAIEKITRSSFGELLGKAFVERHFSADAQKRVNEMVDNLKVVYKERIQKLEWMSAETKKEAVGKLESFGRKLGFPSKWEDFSSLNFTADDYVGNLKEVARYDYQKNLKKLNEKVDRDEWHMPAHMVNAYYHPLLNEIAFPAGIMQPPFFDNEAEDAVNYGRIGMVIGHEFTHGFDDMGSKFAADGSFKNWWTEADRKAFEEKTKTFGETYSNFCPFEGHCVNPDLTMGENIADLGGLTMAYYAYTRTEDFKKNQIRMGFTPAQRFFIAYAQLWKINYTDAELKKRLSTDPHSPGMYRINGPLKNCPEFFTAFDVKEGDQMRNPKGKVTVIW
jgi:putative endopeptidase